MAFCLPLDGAAQAADDGVQLVSATSGSPAGTFTVGVASFSTEIRLRNSATDAATGARRLAPGGLLVRASDGQSVAANWKRKDAAGDVIGPGEQAVFALSAELAAPGIYSTWIDATPVAGGPSERFRFDVTRTAEPLPAEFLADPTPVALDIGFWSLPVRWLGFSGGPPRETLLTLRNATVKPLEFAPPAVLAFTRRSANGATAVATPQLPRVERGNCGAALAPGAACSFPLHFADAMLPGEYAIGVGVAGIGGGWSERSQIVHVRAPWFLAFLVIVAGAACGTYVNGWRSSGRRTASGLVELARAREKLTRIVADPTDAETAGLLQGAADRVETIETAIRQGDDPAAPLSALSAHIGQLQALAAIGKALAGISPEGRAALQPGFSALAARVDVNAAPAQKTDIDAALRAFVADVTDWPRLEAACTAAQQLADAIAKASSAAGADGDDAKAAELVRSLEAAVVAARQAAPARRTAERIEALGKAVADVRHEAATHVQAEAGKLAKLATALLKTAQANGSSDTKAVETLAARAGASSAAPPKDEAVEPALAELAAGWNAYHALDIAVNGPAPKAGAAPTAAAPTFSVPGVPALDLPVELLLPPRDAPEAAIEKARRRNEWLTNGAVLVATGLAGVVALWSPDPNWGTIGNVIAAFLAGMAANVVIGTAAAARQ